MTSRSINATVPPSIVKSYAKAIFNLAIKRQNLDAWESLLAALAMAVQHPGMQRQLKKLGAAYLQQVHCLTEICKPVLFKAGEHFVMLLAYHGRLLGLPNIAEAFSYYRLQYENRLKIQVTSAVALTPDEQVQLQQRLTEQFQKQVVLENDVDTTLLGGMLMRIGSRILNASLRGRLQRLSTRLF